jgi:hypothetical protein
VKKGAKTEAELAAEAIAWLEREVGGRRADIVALSGGVMAEGCKSPQARRVEERIAEGGRADLSLFARMAEVQREAEARRLAVKPCPVCGCRGGCSVVVLATGEGRPEPLMEGRCVPAGRMGLETCSGCLQ